MTTKYIKDLVNINKNSIELIASLEKIISDFKIENDKDKANFGNLCLILKSNRIIADATEAMLNNENVLKDDNNNYYQKIEDEEVEDHINNNINKPNEEVHYIKSQINKNANTVGTGNPTTVTDGNYFGLDYTDPDVNKDDK